RPAAAAERDDALVERLEIESALEHRFVQRDRHPRAETELGAEKVERLAQVTRVDECRAVDLGVAPVFPVASPPACGHDERDVCVCEVPLSCGAFLDQR